MKSILAILALIAFTLTVNAQSYGPVSLPSATLSTVTAGATSNLTYTIDVRKQNNVEVQVDMQGNAANGTLSNVVFTFQKSVTGNSWGTDAASQFTWTPAINGTTAVTSTTNLTANGLGYFRLKSIQNTSTNVAITNLVFSYGVKIPR